MRVSIRHGIICKFAEADKKGDGIRVPPAEDVGVTFAGLTKS